MSKRRKKAKREPADLKCNKCGARIAFVQTSHIGDGYNAKKHGPVNPRSVQLDIDGRKETTGYMVDGMELTGQIVKPGDDAEARAGGVFKVWLLHRCGQVATRANTDGTYGATDQEQEDVRARQYAD